jgi:hypothetical protein
LAMYAGRSPRRLIRHAARSPAALTILIQKKGFEDKG